MRELGLKSKLSKKFKITTDSKHNYLLVENVLNRQFLFSQPSKAWVSDITYIRTKEGFLYLTTVIDLYARKIIGCSLSDGMSTNDPSDSEQAKQTTLASWKMAIRNRNVQNGLIFHCFASWSRALGSDRGVQYANNKFANVLDSYKVTRNMSRTGNC
ncbi:DDE-type integrase/transposase/recombinase [Flavobacterium sp. SM2513]|uniref:DDE-type integrase/transposase/recombinase n=1 Tax=Flavobacterium sp. SM2513 TaxID=3424766 RepID=UPI003D7F2689